MSHLKTLHEVSLYSVRKLHVSYWEIVRGWGSAEEGGGQCICAPLPSVTEVKFSAV